MSRLSMLLVVSLASLLTLSFLSPSRAESVITTVTVGNSPLTPAFDAGNGNLYVTNSAFYGGNTSVSVISGASNSVIATVPIPGGTFFSADPRAATYDPSNGNIYVLNAANNQLYVISGTSNTIIANLTACIPTAYGGRGCGSTSPVFDPANGYLYVGGYGHVIVVDGATNKIVGNVTTAGGPYGNAGIFDPSNGYLYFSSAGGSGPGPLSVVSVISGTSLVTSLSIKLNQYVERPLYDPSNGNIYLYSSPYLLVISGASNTLVGNITVGPSNGGCFCNPTPVLDSHNGNLYVPVNTGVVVVSGTSNSVIANVTIGGGHAGPDGAVLDPATSEIYVTNQFANNVTVISDATNAVVATLAPSSDPVTPTYDPTNGDIYVSSWGGNTVSVISATAAPTSTTTTTSSTSTTSSTTSTSPTITSTTVPTTPTTSTASTPAASTSTASSTTSSGGGSGVPEFPAQLGLTLLATVVIVASYLLARRVLPTRL